MDSSSSFLKSQLRQTLRRRRTMQNAAEAAERSARICALAAGVLPLTPGVVVAGYMPQPGEPDIRPLLHRLQARGVVTVLPCVVAADQPLLFRRWCAGDVLRAGVFEIPEPVSGEALRPSVLLVPGLGFTRDGRRIGHGHGYYDRTLAAWATLDRPAFAAGLCFDAFLCDDLPVTPQDATMDVVITECAVHRRGG